MNSICKYEFYNRVEIHISMSRSGDNFYLMISKPGHAAGRGRAGPGVPPGRGAPRAVARSAHAPPPPPPPHRPWQRPPPRLQPAPTSCPRRPAPPSRPHAPLAPPIGGGRGGQPGTKDVCPAFAAPHHRQLSASHLWEGRLLARAPYWRCSRAQSGSDWLSPHQQRPRELRGKKENPYIHI